MCLYNLILIGLLRNFIDYVQTKYMIDKEEI